MHEMSIAMELLDRLAELTEEHGLERIEALTVTAGVMRGIVPEALELAFETAAKGGSAEGAEPNLEIVDALALCRGCGLRFAPEPSSFLCAGCGEADVEIIQGNEIVLSSISGEQRAERDQA